MNKKLVYYPYPRRKWDNDIVNNIFDNFDLQPKADIKYDGYINFNESNYKVKLKKYKLVRVAIKIKNKIRDKIRNKINPLPKFKVEDINKYDSAVISQQFLKDNNKYKKQYISYIENSHSILDYDYTKYYSGKNSKRVKDEIVKSINDKYFKGFVFYSYRSKIGFYEFYKEIITKDYKFLDVIYPYVKDNTYIDKNIIEAKSKSIQSDEINLLYISSMFSLKGGCEIIESFKILRNNYNIKLIIVTEESTIPNKYENYILETKDIKILKNNLDGKELNELYSKCHILLHPTFMDSTAIVIMEALKSGLPVIATDTFAIPEYIDHGKNGFLIENPIKYFDLNYNVSEPIDFFGGKDTAKLIDKYKSNNLYNYIIADIIKYTEIILTSYEEYSMNAYEMALNSEYSEKAIYNKWNNIIEKNLI